MSPSTITKLLLELTSGEIKSRAGLDNNDVNKGHANFEHMSQMIDMLTPIIGSDEPKTLLGIWNLVIANVCASDAACVARILII